MCRPWGRSRFPTFSRGGSTSTRRCAIPRSGRRWNSEARPRASPASDGSPIRPGCSRPTYPSEGAAPVPIAWGETYLAMSQGTVGAVDTTVSDGRDSKLPEVSKYLSLTNTFHSIAGIYASKRWLDGLTPEQRKIVVDSAKSAAKFADVEEPKLYE